MSFFKHLFRKGEKDVHTNMTFNKPSKPAQQDLTAILCKTWQQLDVKILEPYLDDNFRYNSVWVGETLKGKREYLQYLKCKFETLKNTDNCPIMDIINEYGMKLPHFLQGNNEGVLDYEQKDGKILSMLMRPVIKIKIVDEPEWKIYADAYHAYLPKAAQIAGKSLNDIVEEQKYDISRFGWLQTFPNYPSFQHLCFRKDTQVFSILIALHGFTSSDGIDDNNIIVSKRDYDNLINESELNHLVPCIFPICGIPDLPMLRGSHLIHSKTGLPIDLDGEYDKDGHVSKWEINNMGISYVAHYLHEHGCKNINYCDVIGIEPQIFFEKDGTKSFVIVRSIPTGLRDEIFEINEKMLSKLSDRKGYFADVQFAEMINNGDFNDKTLWRGDKYICKFNGLQKIDDAAKSNLFIRIVEKPNYDVTV